MLLIPLVKVEVSISVHSGDLLLLFLLFEPSNSLFSLTRIVCWIRYIDNLLTLFNEPFPYPLVLALAEFGEDSFERNLLLVGTKQGCDTIRKISGRGAAAREILESRSGGRAWRKGKRKALKVLRAVLPERYRIAGNAGLGDPAATGTLMMAQSVLYPWTGERLLVLPDFESEEITLDITGEGRGAFMIATVLFGFLALYLDKDVRFVWERLKREVLNGGES